MDNFFDPAEVIFVGPPTPREVFLLKQRFPESKGLESGDGSNAMEKSAQPNSSKGLSREDFDSTMDYIEHVLESEGDDPDSARDDKENLPDILLNCDEQRNSTIIKTSTVIDQEEEPQSRKIVLGPYSPITPDVSMHENQDEIIPHLQEVDAVLSKPSPLKPRVPPPNIKFVTSEEKGTPRSKERTTKPMRTPSSVSSLHRTQLARVKGTPGKLADKVRSPVANYVRGMVSETERHLTPLTKIVRPKQVLGCHKPNKFHEEPAKSSEKKKFPQLRGEIGSAGKIFMHPGGPSEKPEKAVYTKIGTVPLTVAGVTKEYSLYEKD